MEYIDRNVSPINIAIADDDDMYLYAITKIITLHNISVNIMARNGKELLEKLEHSTKPIDICILDLSMPVMNGYETLPLLRKKWPSIKVLVLSVYCREYSITHVINDGARGFLSKTRSENIIQALHAIYNNGYYFSEHAPEEMFRKVQKGKITVSGISKKEMEVLKYICTEYTYETIAQKMCISKRTLEVHRDNLFRKLNVRSRSELIIFALLNEIIIL